MKNIVPTFINEYLDEKELTKLISIDNEGKLNYNLFKNLLDTPYLKKSYMEYEGFFVAENILRTELGFDNRSKPGDFDIVIIPFSKKVIHFNKTCAIEVKIVRPTRMKPSKNANSLGVSQTLGLIHDGFPFVGLLHVCMTEPLKENEKKRIKYIGGIGGEEAENDILIHEAPEHLMDDFSRWSSIKQMKRLLATDLPKYVGICTVGVNVTEKNSFSLAFDMSLNSPYTCGYFNPRRLEETQNKIKLFFNEYRHRFREAGK
ncbi:hypothetical protein [Maribacter sp. ACAM166]|uniref:hypothetical protein n=1 Tax=Maribacter sp. ACAM166 TaxID=2508996 RepID=UPI0010FE621E|nr:hypothetical protein [Maribacter sp. ACAM166]TLP81841.1 hypothetical protein ES765_03945 [Maribacter sp. ACAM166]